MPHRPRGGKGITHMATSEVVDAAARPPRVEPIPLARIKDGGAQIRVEMRPEIVNDYANDMLDGAVFPPIVVFYDGSDYWQADGFHRVEAGRKIGRETIVAENQGRLFAGRGPVWHRLQRGARSASHPGGQETRGRAVAERSRMGTLVRSQDRQDRQGRSQDRRRDPSGTGWGIPTTKAAKVKRGAFPTANGKPNNRASLLGDVLRTIPDDVLVAECRRRGLTVEAANA